MVERKVLRQNGEEFIPFTEIADDLITTEEGVSLSAKQGVAINGRLVDVEKYGGRIDQLETKTQLLDLKTDNLETKKQDVENMVDWWPEPLSPKVYPNAQLMKTELGKRELLVNKQDVITENTVFYPNNKAVMDFVNSSIQTFTASFKGAWPTYASIPTDGSAWKVEPKRNDYIVVQKDENHEGQTWRYKYDMDDPVNEGYDKSKWRAEYPINDTVFTDAQIKAVNSGITQELVLKLVQLFTDFDNLTTKVNGLVTDMNNLATRISSLENTTLTSRDPTTNTGNSKERR